MGVRVEGVLNRARAQFSCVFANRAADSQAGANDRTGNQSRFTSEHCPTQSARAEFFEQNDFSAEIDFDETPQPRQRAAKAKKPGRFEDQRSADVCELAARTRRARHSLI